MRTRTRGSSTQSNYGHRSIRIDNPNGTYQYYKGAQIPPYSYKRWSSNYSVIQKSDVEEITDDTGPELSYRPVDHVKETIDFPDPDMGSKPIVSDSGQPLTLSWENEGFNRCFSYASAPAYLQADAISGINLQKPPRLIDVGRFIAELTEFREGCMHLMELYRDFVSQSTRWVNRYYRRPRARRAALNAIQADLGWKFFIRPFIGDLQKMIHHGQRLDKIMADLRNPKPFVVRSRATDVSYGQGSPSNSVALLREEHRWERTCVAWVLARYKPPQSLNLLAERLRYMFGLDLIRLELPWELLPRSFVIDWFVNVGDWIRDLESYSNTSLWKYEVLFTGMSFKDVQDWTSTCIVGNGYSTIDKFEDLSEVVTASQKSSYSRQAASFEVDFPGGIMPDLSLPNFQQFVTLLEMLVTGSKVLR